jgi:hypothetical protein
VGFFISYINPRANGAKCRSGRKPGAWILMPPGYLHLGIWEHSESAKLSSIMWWIVFDVMRMREYKLALEKLFSILQRCILLLYNIFLRCISLLTGNKPAVSWISGCEPWNKMWKRGDILETITLNFTMFTQNNIVIIFFSHVLQTTGVYKMQKLCNRRNFKFC